jgi:hypothetical protein
MSTSLRVRTINFRRREFRFHYAIEAHGVKIGVSTNTAEALRAAKKRIADVLPEFTMLDNDAEADHRFLYVWNPSGRDTFYKNGETVIAGNGRDYVLDEFASTLRLTVAEYAVDRVFVHAGVVCWKNKAIVLPGYSFTGKSNLTVELVRRGAIYYSDEYAILDERGYVHPFPKKLSIRGDRGVYQQVDHPVEKFGGVAGTVPVEVGMILITQFKRNARWKPQKLSKGKGVFEILAHTLPIRRDPKYALSVLGRLSMHTPIVKTDRGEVEEFAGRIIDFFEANCL